MNEELDILFDKETIISENKICLNEFEQSEFNLFALKNMICLLVANFSLPQG